MRPQVPLDQLDEAELRKRIQQNHEDLVDLSGAGERAEQRRRLEEIKREQASRRQEAIKTVLFRNPRYK